MAPCLPVCVKPWLLLVKPWTCCHQLAPPVRSGNTLASYLLLDSLSCSYQPTSIFTIPPWISNDCHHCIHTHQQTQQGSTLHSPQKDRKESGEERKAMRKERRELFWKLVKELSLQSFFLFLLRHNFSHPTLVVLHNNTSQSSPKLLLPPAAG